MLRLLTLLLVVMQSRGVGAEPPTPACVQGIPRIQWTNPLDRKLIVVEGREFLLELRVGSTEVAQLDETTKKPLLDWSGQPVTLPILHYKVFIITPDSKGKDPRVLLGEAELMHVHFSTDREILHAGALGWDSKSKSLFLIASLSLNNSADLEILQGPVVLCDKGLLSWQLSNTPLGSNRIDGTELSGDHPVEKLEVSFSESTIDLALLRRRVDGTPTRVSYAPATKEWRVDGREYPRR